MAINVEQMLKDGHSSGYMIEALQNCSKHDLADAYVRTMIDNATYAKRLSEATGNAIKRHEKLNDLIELANGRIRTQKVRLFKHETSISVQHVRITEQTDLIAEQKARNATYEKRLSEVMDGVSRQTVLMAEQKARITEQTDLNTEQTDQIAEQKTLLAEQTERIARYKARYAKQKTRLTERNARVTELKAELAALKDGDSSGDE